MLGDRALRGSGVESRLKQQARSNRKLVIGGWPFHLSVHCAGTFFHRCDGDPRLCAGILLNWDFCFIEILSRTML